MAVITMRQMLEAGVHFGHQTRRWNPKMKRFIFGERNGIYIIDLEQTLTRVERAYAYVRDLVAGGGVILFVGTKKQAQDPVRSYAEKCGMPYVNERWLGGMLTNFDTISKRVGKMLEYERMRDSGEFDAMPKKEALILSRELEKLQRNLGGLRGLNRKPDAIFVLDTKKEHIAVTEANKLGIPVVAVVDTNVDPELVQYPIPGNDDAIRANSLLARVIADAVEEGRFIAAKRERGPAPMARSAEEEAEFNAQQAAARREAAAAQMARERRLETATTPTAADAGSTDGGRESPAEALTPDAGPSTADVSSTAATTSGPVTTDQGVLGVEATSGMAAVVEADDTPATAPAAPDVSSEPAADATPDTAANATAATADEVASDSARPAAADLTSETAADATPETAADATPETAADATPETAADATPETAADVTSETADVPPAAAETTSDSAPPAADETTSDSAPPAADETTSDNVPPAAAEATPETAAPAAEPTPETDASVGAEATPEMAPPADDGESATTSTPVEAVEGPYGPGSARAADDGTAPAVYAIKGDVDSMLYHVPGSRYYDATVAEVWFDTAEHAEAAGFTAPATA
jgi:small subunit ribosomal protein S2